MMKSVTLVLFLTVVIFGAANCKKVALESNAHLFNEEIYRNEFTLWLIENEKHYSNEEFVKRYQIFRDNYDFVHEWNSKGSETILGMNLFADLSNEEFNRIYLNKGIDVEQKVKENPHSQFPENYRYVNSLQDQYADDQGVIVDWRTKGAVSEVKNQGACGSCWSFSTTGSIESAHFMATGKMVLLSEQNLMDCTFPYGNLGCGGGEAAPAYKYIIENGGIDTEESYPYTAQNGKDGCQFNASNVGATLSNYNFVLPFFSEKALAYMVRERPISVSIDAAQPSFQLYSGGIYYEPKCSQTFLTHDVLAVGFGSGALPSDSFDASQSDSWSGKSITSSASASTASGSGSQSQSSAYQTSGSQTGQWSASVSTSTGMTTSTPVPSTTGASNSASGSGSGGSSANYWIVKNSWTPEWGINGYIYMSRDRNNNCGISSYAKYPII